MDFKELIIELIKIEDQKKQLGIVSGITITIILFLTTNLNWIAIFLFSFLSYFLTQIIDFKRIKENKKLKNTFKSFSKKEKEILSMFSNTSDGFIYFYDDAEFYEKYSITLKRLEESSIISHQFEEVYQKNYFYLNDMVFLDELKKAKRLELI